MSSKPLIVVGTALLVAGIAFAIVNRSGGPKHRAAPPPPPPTTTTAPPPPPTTTAPPPPPPKPIPMSWQNAGAIIWHVHDSDPEWIGQQMRADGFGWVAINVGPGNPPNIDWIDRFERVSGLAVGGWSVLGSDPHADATLAARFVHQGGLSFYIADAEAPYQASPQRSQAFVDAFRAAEPSLPAGLSSFCDANGIGLAPWAHAGFAFLPQAYVNDFGDSVSPASCVGAAAQYFPRDAIHPTVACYTGKLGYLQPNAWARLLAQAGTTGFSIYPAETLVNAQDWQTYGNAITSLHIAARPS